MKAIGYTGGKPLDQPDAFVRFECETPVPTGRDILVSVRAVSVNPVDTKVRSRITEAQDPPRILGWDAAGIVDAVGSEATLFRPGDAVFYAGDITRPGSNATHQLVDERIVGHQPGSASFAQAAALPLTAITAWEALFERLKIRPEADAGKRILIIGGAGGVGSIAVQLAKQVARLEVIATASRDETRHWCRSQGADHTVNHHTDMPAEFREQGIAAPDYILCTNGADRHFPAMIELIAPQGMICTIVESTKGHDLDALKTRSAGFVWEFMFTRSMFRTPDMIRQHELLNEIARLIDAGKIVSTLNSIPGSICPEAVRAAHRTIETGRSIGKIVLEGFGD
jgi:zinc-binding alcohol dehydrogenase family protein